LSGGGGVSGWCWKIIKGGIKGRRLFGKSRESQNKIWRRKEG